MTELRDRLLAKIDVSGGKHACHLWTGFVDRAGYGRIRLGGRSEPVGYAHRVAYELVGPGPIPEGLELDHLCRNRRCVNHRHLEAVTHKANATRGMAPNMILHRAGVCANGHPASLHACRKKNGTVAYCRACRREARAA